MNTSGNDMEMPDHYTFRNLSTGDAMEFVSIAYNPSNWTATLTFDTGQHWDPNSQYSVTMQQNLANRCLIHQGHDVTITFSTGS